MKKVIILAAVVIMAVSLAACSGEATVTTSEEKTVTVGSVENLELMVEEDVADTTDALRSEYDQLVAEVDSFEAYKENVGRVQEFYDNIYEETRQLCIRMREYSVAYAQLILNSDGTNDEKDAAIDDMYDCIYEDACEDIYDAVYEDLSSDMYDAFYDGVVSDGYDYIAYERWYDMSSEAYDMWSDCGSDIYDEWSDCGSDIYDFWSDIYGAFWDGDEAEVEEEIADFQAKIDALKAAE